MPFSPSSCILLVFSSGDKLFSCQLLHVLVSPCPQTSFFWYSCWFLLVCETSSPPWPKVGFSLFVFIFSSFLCQCLLVLEWVSSGSSSSFSFSSSYQLLPVVMLVSHCLCACFISSIFWFILLLVPPCASFGFFLS